MTSVETLGGKCLLTDSALSQLGAEGCLTGLWLGFLRFQDVCPNIGSRKPVTHINHRHSWWHHWGRKTYTEKCGKTFIRMLFCKILWQHTVEQWDRQASTVKSLTTSLTCDFLYGVQIFRVRGSPYDTNRTPGFLSHVQTRRAFWKSTESFLDTSLFQLTIGRNLVPCLAVSLF